jgi:hypothetical protein
LKDKNKLSSNELREKVDGFKLNLEEETTPENHFVTTDQGVYSPPDSYLNGKGNNK